MIIYAASTQRTIGLTLAIIVAAGFALYVLINIRTGRKEIGAEVELAPNRKKYFDDEILETRRLDIALTAGVAVLIIIALCLPLYWLGEPGRQEGYENLTGNQFASRGGEAYEELCAQCHGAAGVGGQAAFTVLDEQGRYISGVNWAAPALNAILYRFTKAEVTHVLNYGRPQSPMPAWGGPGGGPLTTQQIEELVAYLAAIQLTPEQMASEVSDGLRESVLVDMRASMKDASDEEMKEGFNNLIDGLGDALEEQQEIKANSESTIEAIDEIDNKVLQLLDEHLSNLAATNDQLKDLEFASKICKNTKSNAIVLVNNNQLLASGVGQTSRVDALKQAVVKAKAFGFDLNGAVMASDAFFPFPDCVELANNEGIKAVIQPGGSIKDQLSID